MSNAATFIIPGNLPHLARIARYLNDSVCGILLHQRLAPAAARAARVCPDEFADRLYTLEDLRTLTGEALAEADWPVYERCLNALLADQRAHYLAMRSYFNSAFNNTVAIEKILVNSLRIIRKTRPARLVSSSTPHSVEAWVFATCCEQVGIPVFILERTPINNRAWVYAGMDRQEVVPRANAATNVAVSDYSQQQVREQQEAQAGQRDKHGFYVSRMDLSSVKGAESNRWWSYRRELPQLFAGRLLTLPLRLASLYLKRRLLASYRQVEAKTLPNGPFVIFFMHYQPERSSLPEGLHYVQQWLAIRLLSWMLPPGWTVLVREHPTMWLQPLDVTVRTPDLFTELAALPRTQICSMDIDTFELIDKAAVVATLTGSVGFQALLRGKPVLAFGLPAYKDHPACFAVRSAQELLASLREIERGNLGERFSREALTQYLLWVERNSVAADLQETDWLEARLKNFSELYRQLFAGELVL